MIVINATNINKPEESLNSDSHQCHQYQQNEQPPFILTEHTEHKKEPQLMMLEIHIHPGLELARKWVGLNRFIGFQPSSLMIISPTAIHIINTKTKNLHRLASDQKDHICNINSCLIIFASVSFAPTIWTLVNAVFIKRPLFNH